MLTYDKKINRYFYYWLLISFFLIFFMVLVGGLTRLTDSGLSITEWELFSGIIPPLTDEKWGKYFFLYQQIPQYKLLNYNMTLDEFKIIFYWEFFHRVLGRVIGLFFLIPLIYFYFTSKINSKYLSLCFIVLFLIIIQGIIGWYMVKSGLSNNISVSHYRLSLHLLLAFIIISIIFWNLLNIRMNTIKNFFANKLGNYIFYSLILLIFTQIIIGAFVSGLDAGKIYQTWPLMDESYFPDYIKLENFAELIIFSDHGLVQFYHRNIAYLIFVYILVVGFFIYNKKLFDLFKPYTFVFVVLILQIILGITTLISGINIFLASAHQICSLFLILSIINLYYRYIN